MCRVLRPKISARTSTVGSLVRSCQQLSRFPWRTGFPLYIPPYAVANKSLKVEEHNRLEEEATAALARGDHITHDRLRDDQKKLSEFRPWMTHSHYEQAPGIVFHYQLLSDYATIDELALKLLDELKSHSGGQVQK